MKDPEKIIELHSFVRETISYKRNTMSLVSMQYMILEYNKFDTYLNELCIWYNLSYQPYVLDQIIINMSTWQWSQSKNQLSFSYLNGESSLNFPFWHFSALSAKITASYLRSEVLCHTSLKMTTSLQWMYVLVSKERLVEAYKNPMDLTSWRE